jgi:hypothetical protein
MQAAWNSDVKNYQAEMGGRQAGGNAGGEGARESRYGGRE